MRATSKWAAAAIAVAAIIALPLGAEARSLTPEQVVSAALAGDARVESATWDQRSSEAKAEESELRKLPSLSLSASYTRLSDVTSRISLGPSSFTISSLDNAFSLNANLQYPVFAGFRLRESAALASLQAEGKAISAEMTRRSIAFEAQRAYWEAKRAALNAGMVKESLALAAQGLEQVRRQAEHGTAMKADLLAAQMRYDQARMDLDAATNVQRRAAWNLAALVDPAADPGAEPQEAYVLSAEPAPVPDSRFPSLDQGELERLALQNRPETRASAISMAAAEAGRKLAEAPLYPTLSLTGGYVFADPNSRVAFQTDPWKFTGTWTLGAALSYDVGGLPANLKEREAQAAAASKSVADDRRQRQSVALDLRASLLAFLQSRRDYALLSGMIDQARENERVTEQKLAVGSASDLDLLTARLARLKVEFSIQNKLIDEQIAAADLERAAALAKL